MTNERIKKIHRIYGILLSLVLVAAGICLIVACVGVYRGGDAPLYSREEVAAAFRPIAAPVYAALVLAVGGAVLHLLLPTEEERLRAPYRPARVLRSLRRRAVLTEEQQHAARKAQKARRLHNVITALLAAVGAAVFLLYALDGSHFPPSDGIKEGLNDAMIRAMWVLLPCLAVPFAYGVFTAYYCRRSMEGEIALLKGADLSGKPTEQPPAKGGFPLTAVRCALLAVGLFLLIYGFATGGIADVLTKAVNICTECIGLG